MTAYAAIHAGRQAAERLMVDTCEIVRIVHTVDEDGLDTTREEIVYRGRCKVQSQTVQENATVSAGAPLVVDRIRLDLPATAGPFQVGDVAQVEGRTRRLRITGLLEKTFQTAQRLPVEEVIGL